MRKHFKAFKARDLFQEGVKDDNVYQIKAAVYRCFITRSLQEDKYKFTLFRTVAFYFPWAFLPSWWSFTCHCVQCPWYRSHLFMALGLIPKHWMAVFSSFNYTRKNAQVATDLQTSCNKSVHKLLTRCIRTSCSEFVRTSLEQAVDKL